MAAQVMAPVAVASNNNSSGSSNNKSGVVVEERPRKRRRFTWDYAGPLNEVQLAALNIQNIASSGYDTSCAASSNMHCSGEVIDPSSPWRQDDKDGHIMFEIGDKLSSRYQVLRKMGEGTFGRVLECWDGDTQERVAIKVIRNVQKYRDAAMIEINVLHVLANSGQAGRRGCVQMRRWFDHHDHVCIVCEKLGPSLYDFLQANSYRPFSLDLIRDFGFQLLQSIAYIHSLSLIHTDLKPENVLLVSSEYSLVADNKKNSRHETQLKRVPKSSHIKLIDFGSATFEDQYHSKIVSTRHYRAPEVILGLGWSYPCDIWSVGCILLELCSGETLFKTHEDLEHLAMMEQVLGPIPQHVIKRVDDKDTKYFRHSRRLNWPEGATSRESLRAVRKLPCLKELLAQHVDQSARLFADLLQGIFKYDPVDRLTAREALAHPFFNRRSRR